MKISKLHILKFGNKSSFLTDEGFFSLKYSRSNFLTPTAVGAETDVGLMCSKTVNQGHISPIKTFTPTWTVRGFQSYINFLPLVNIFRNIYILAN